MRRVDIMSIVGLVGGTGIVLLAIVLGGNLVLFWSVSSILVTIGGSLGALLLNCGSTQILGALKTTIKVFMPDIQKPQEVITVFGDLARKARREGLLGLEDDMDRLPDPFFQKGLRMMVDAMDPELIREVLNIDIESMQHRHELGQQVFKTWGSYAPAFGMIGTLIGLVQMLAQLDDPSTLGPAMSLALLTTLYGTLVANLVCIPMAGKLQIRSEEEILVKEIMVEAIISIQSGINPRVLEEKLFSFLPPGQRISEGEEGGSIVE